MLTFTARLINLEWAKHCGGAHHMFSASSGIKDDAGNVLVTSFALRRPDGNWFLMLVNRDDANPHTIRVAFEDSSRRRAAIFSGPVTMVTSGSAPKASVSVLSGKVGGLTNW